VALYICLVEPRIGPGIAQSVQRLSTGWTVRGSNPGGGEIFHTRPVRPWGPPILLYNGYRVSFPGVKRPGRGVDHSPSSSTEVKERLLPLCTFAACSRVKFKNRDLPLG
jgi:hypothetical protein